MSIGNVRVNYVSLYLIVLQVPETFILVPALLGLKGNLEMTLASRLSTLVRERERV